MAKFKLKKFPKAPKRSASTETWVAYKKRCQDVNRENQKVVNERRKHETAVKQARAVKPVKFKKA